MATVTETVKESLIGATREPQLSQLARATFLKHARKDEDTGELFMNEVDFVDAIAPINEDYVSLGSLFDVPICVQSSGNLHTGADERGGIAQNQARAICNPFPCGR